MKSGVMLPGTVFTMALESAEARAAADAAASAGGRIVLVPQLLALARLGHGYLTGRAHRDIQRKWSIRGDV
ncbi:MAG: hypothetical protein ACYCSX_17795, partial [Acidimicrobiales bacterium]